MREAMGDVGVDRPLPLDDLVEAARWNAEVFGKMPNADAARGEEFFQ
jgi:hypothetical protein